MKRKSISPEKAKFISSLLVTITFMVIALIASGLYTKRMLERARNQYFESLTTSTQGFAKIISTQLTDYKDILSTFYLDYVFSSEDTKQIFDFLKKYHYKKLNDFNHLYFMTPDGTAYLSDGRIIHMVPENHAGPDSTTFFVSDLLIPPGEDEFVFCVEKAIFNDENEFTGVMGASINIDAFKEKNHNIKIGPRESFMLLDRNGVFLLHPRKEIIGRTFVPEDKRLMNTSTIAMAKSPAMTTYSQQDDGSYIYLVTSKIPESGWTLAVKTSLDEIDAIYKPQMRIEVLIFVFLIIIILALVTIESKVMNFFQQKQIIETIYDPLTNTWTRVRFEQEAQRMLKNDRHSKFVLIEADIRGLKFINQNYGEETADQVIVYFANALKHFAAENHAIIGRGFADRFYIFMRISSIHNAMKVLREKISGFENKVKNYDIPFFPKYGISFCKPEDRKEGISIQTLIGQASFAKSSIKDNLIINFSVYNSRMLEKVRNERFLENHMNQALEDGEFFVMYQPKIALADDKIVGAEALVRWNNKELGIILPDNFIPIFEKNGFITKLDYYVYDKVFSFIRTLIDRGEKIVPISVNMSRNHNKPEKFMHDFLEIFNKYQIPPTLVQIEILERSVMDNTTLKDITDRLHEAGFSVAMDDFGSGESSLNMLTKIPVDVLKFDREFLNASTDKNGRIDKKSENFIHGLIELSKNLEKQTIFEGVETQAQRDFLRSVECDQAQGFFYSRPLTEKDFIEFIKLHS